MRCWMRSLGPIYACGVAAEPCDDDDGHVLVETLRGQKKDRQRKPVAVEEERGENRVNGY